MMGTAMEGTACAAIAAALVLGGCANEGGTPPGGRPATPDIVDTAQIPDAHTTRNSVDWNGTYRGTIPCADCPGIETSLTLRLDGTYMLSSVYLDEDKPPFEAAGSFSWQEDGSTIVLDAAGDGRRFFVAEGYVILLYADGSRPTGPTADAYVLRKNRLHPPPGG